MCPIKIQCGHHFQLAHTFVCTRSSRTIDHNSEMEHIHNTKTKKNTTGQTHKTLSSGECIPWHKDPYSNALFLVWRASFVIRMLEKYSEYKKLSNVWWFSAVCSWAENAHTELPINYVLNGVCLCERNTQQTVFVQMAYSAANQPFGVSNARWSSYILDYSE